MQYVIGGLVALFAAYVALWLLVAALFYLVVPAFLVMVTAGVLGGVVFAAVVAVLTVGGIGGWGARTVTPEDVVSGTVRIPWRKKNEPFRPDNAWPSYLVGQWRFDLEQGWRNASGVLTRMLRRLNWFTSDRDAPILWVPVLAFPYGAWLAITVGALLGGSVVVVLGALVLAPAWLVAVTLIGLTRSVDFLVRKRRQAAGSCRCQWVTMLPVYRCDHCAESHRDLRPGWLGVLWHRCRCGRRLPTTVLRAAKQLEATCPRCGTSLAAGAGALTDIRLPVFGPMSAGKTRLVYAALVALQDRLTFDDKQSRRTFDAANEIIKGGENTQKTVAGGQLPPPVTARVANGRRPALLHLFDAAGEHYVDRESNTELEFLDHAQGLVFVVDPFSVPWVTDQLTGARHARLAAAHPATEDPDAVYRVTAQRLADYGVRTRERHLAIAVVKSDLLTGLPFAADLLAGNVREWLNEADLDNLVQAAERDFAEVRYFAVASVATPSEESLSPANPFTWLMSKVGS